MSMGIDGFFISAASSSDSILYPVSGHIGPDAKLDRRLLLFLLSSFFLLLLTLVPRMSATPAASFQLLSDSVNGQLREFRDGRGWPRLGVYLHRNRVPDPKEGKSSLTKGGDTSIHVSPLELGDFVCFWAP